MHNKIDSLSHIIYQQLQGWEVKQEGLSKAAKLTKKIGERA